MSVANLVASADARGRVGLPVLDGRYVATARLGRGASGSTWAAEDVARGDRCVVKLFGAGAGAEIAGEFRRLASLAHPSVVRVRDVGRAADGRAFLVTDLVGGPGLDVVAAIVDDTDRVRRFERLARDLADALAYLHARGLVHGDVAAANVRFAADGRAVLLDLGLAGAPRDGVGGARGTLGYAPPEALVGVRGVAGDLFGLGATLFEAWTGAPPFGHGLAAVQRMLTTRAPRLSAVRAGLPPAWDDLGAALLASEAAQRPASARDVLRLVARASHDGTPSLGDFSAPFPEGDPLEGVFVGRAAERETLRRALEPLAEGAAPRAAIAVVGAPGSGRRTLIESVVREVALAAAAGVTTEVHVARGEVEVLEALVGVAGSAVAEADEARREQRRFAALAEALERSAASRPLCAVLPESSLSEAFLSFMAGAPPSGRIVIVAPTTAPVARPFVENVVLAPLGDEAVRALVARAAWGEDVPSEAADAIVAAAGGHAALAAALARRLALAVREKSALDPTALARPGDDLTAVLAAGFAALSEEARATVVALSLTSNVEAARAIAGLDEVSWSSAFAAARREGWVRAPGVGEGLTSPAHAAIAREALREPAFALTARRAVDALAVDDPARAEALAAAGRAGEGATLLRRLAAAAFDEASAAAWLERASALLPGALDAREERVLATGLGVRGRYAEAASALDRAAALARASVAQADEGGAVAERRAWLLARTGDLAGAAAVLREALAAGPSHDVETALRARLGRLLVTAGRAREALDALGPLLAADARAPVLAFEAATLAHAYAGASTEARAAAAAFAARGGDPGRHAYLEALVAQLAGDGDGARAGYRRAYELASAAGDVHTLAAVALNLGAQLADEGVFGEALAATERAVRTLGQLGATSELGTALGNAANQFLELGDLPAARRALDRARGETARWGGEAAVGLVAFVDGDVARREGRFDDALARYAEAERTFAASRQTARAMSAALAAVEALAVAGRAEEGTRRLAALSPPADEALAARARLALAGADLDVPIADVAARAEAAALASRAHRPAAWRLAVLAARLHARAGAPDRAAAALAFARTLHEEIRMATPQHHRAGLDSDPDAAWLSGLAPSAPDTALAARAAETEARLRRLLRINKRLNSEQRLPRLLETIIDTVIEVTDAERGFLLLEDETGELAVKVARNIDQKTLEAPELALSRSIAREAAAKGEPIVTIDAAGDARFKEALSVSDLHLRSVLAVPLVVKGRAVGTIYVDHRLRKGVFGEDDVKLVLDVADQAAIAIENARLVAELRRRERQVEALNRRLEHELAARREELTGMKVELRENREALAVRYDYRNIVGRTPRMLDLFRLLDRVTDTALPVVIQGESGTGKELVARALHFNGPRKDRAFVSENCAAIPETLLESTLFGYVRGAFTGADRDARGLFEVADGGTLFLDEIAEMSPGMQGKLLRVLQEGELRRVGAERTRKVDVRVVAATNRDLARLVEEGKFRADLYFRLNVARVALPPLRDRRDDIPAIVAHFVARCAGGGPAKPVEPAALARLVAYRWPGNVRELENEITRAYALSGERITVADLAPAIAAAGEGVAAPVEDADSLLLKPRVERLERALLREALGRSGQNQTKAAELLGLSRFGLQKKLKRYKFT